MGRLATFLRHAGLVPASTGPLQQRPRGARHGGPRHEAGVTKLVGGLALLLASALAGAATVALAGEEAVRHRTFATGAEAIDPAEYAKLPAVPTYRAFTPYGVDLSDEFPKPGWQGQQASCVAWATTYASSSYFHGERIGRQPRQPAELMSPGFLYTSLRPAGASCNRPLLLKDALVFLRDRGAVSYADFATDVDRCDAGLPAGLTDKARGFRLRGFRRIMTRPMPGFPNALNVDDIKGELYQERPVVFIMAAPQSFMDLSDGRTYQHLQPTNVNRHAMAIVGYDDKRQAFRVINSWGESWGDKGYAWVGYDTFRLLATEAYVLEGPGNGGLTAKTELSPAAALDGLVAGAPAKCGQVRMAREKGRLVLTGFLGDAAALAELRAKALEVDPRAEVAVEHHPFPQCEAELTLARQVASSPVRLAATDADGRARPGDVVALKNGELFGLTVTAPADLPYVSIVYVQADGSAVELYRGTPQLGGKLRSVTVGTGGPKETRYQVSAPFGNELVVALASKEPLFGAELDDYRTERQFLTGLRARMLRVQPGQAAAAVLRLRTTG